MSSCLLKYFWSHTEHVVLSETLECFFQATDIITKLYNMFIQYDCTQVEINPMAEAANGKGKSSSSFLSHFFVVVQIIWQAVSEIKDKLCSLLILH